MTPEVFDALREYATVGFILGGLVSFLVGLIAGSVIGR